MMSPDIPSMNVKNSAAAAIESAAMNSDSEDLNITTMSSSSSSSSSPSTSPSLSDHGSCSPTSIVDHETNDSEHLEMPIKTTNSSGCILKFSIEKIMEPESNKNRDYSREKRKNNSDESYDSAFKKYIPNPASVHQFVNRSQDFLSQYPLLYYPNQLMCAAAQYAVLTQQHNSCNLLSTSNNNNNNNNNSSPNGISTSLTQLSNLAIQSYHHHHSTQNHAAIKRVNSPEKITSTTPLSQFSGGKLIRKGLFESPADKKLVASQANSNSNNNSVVAVSSSTAIAGKPKTFSCPECGKIFNAHYNLTRHMPVHTGARPFICKVISAFCC
jgi:Fez family zinc finger protein